VSRAILLSVLLILVVGGAVFAQGVQTRAAWPAYALSIVLGLGTGQWYLGENGLGFLIGDVSGVAIAAGGAAYLYEMLVVGSSPVGSDSFAETVAIGSTIVGAGALVFLVSRVWGILDIVDALDRDRQAGKVANLEPVIEMRPQGVAFELSYKL